MLSEYGRDMAGSPPLGPCRTGKYRRVLPVFNQAFTPDFRWRGSGSLRPVSSTIWGLDVIIGRPRLTETREAEEAKKIEFR